MAEQLANIVRKNFDTVAQAEAPGAMLNGQWAWTEIDKVLVTKDENGVFNKYPLESILLNSFQVEDFAKFQTALADTEAFKRAFLMVDELTDPGLTINLSVGGDVDITEKLKSAITSTNGSPSTLNLTAIGGSWKITINASEFAFNNISTINLNGVDLYIKKLNFDQPTLTINKTSAELLHYENNISGNTLAGDVVENFWSSNKVQAPKLISNDASLRDVLSTPLVSGDTLILFQSSKTLQLTAGSYPVDSSIKFISYYGVADATWLGEVGVGGMKFESVSNVIWSIYNTKFEITGAPQDWELDNIQLECRTLALGVGTTFTYTGSGALGYENLDGELPVSGDAPFKVFWDDPLGDLVVDVPKAVKANILSTGWQAGGVMTQNTTTSIDVTIGKGTWVDNYTDPENPIVQHLEAPAVVNFIIPNIATTAVTYFGWELSGGVPVLVYKNNLKFTASERRTIVSLGFVSHPTGVISIIRNKPQTSIDLRQFQRDIGEAIGPIALGGNVYSGASTNDLQLQKTSGNIFEIDISQITTPKTPNKEPYPLENPVPFFFTGFQDVTQPTGFAFPTKTAIVPGVYDDGTGPNPGDNTIPNGTVASSRWQIMRIWIAPDSKLTAIAYGQETYNNLARAEGKIQSEIFNSPLEAEDFLGRAWLIVRGGATNLNDIGDAKFITAGKFGFTGAGGGGQSTSTTNFQETYENSGLNPQILLDNIRGAFGIIDNVVPIGSDLFYVRDNSNVLEFLAVDSSGIRTVKGVFKGMGALGPNIHIEDNLVEPTVKNIGDWYRIGSETNTVGSSFKLVNTLNSSSVELLNNTSPAGGVLLLRNGVADIEAIMRSYALSAIQLSLEAGGIECFSKIIINHTASSGQHELNTGGSGAFQRLYDQIGSIMATIRSYAASGIQTEYLAGGLLQAGGGALGPNFRRSDNLVDPTSPLDGDDWNNDGDIKFKSGGQIINLSDLPKTYDFKTDGALTTNALINDLGAGVYIGTAGKRLIRVSGNVERATTSGASTVVIGIREVAGDLSSAIGSSSGTEIDTFTVNIPDTSSIEKFNFPGIETMDTAITAGSTIFLVVKSQTVTAATAINLKLEIN